MNILQSLILGIVEGLTEFLPISSTFHLIMVGKILGLADNSYLKLYEVVIQSGAILALLFTYAKTLLFNRKLFIMVSYSFIPTATIGYALHSTIKNVFFDSNGLMLTAFVGVGVIFLLLEKYLSHYQIELKKDCQDLSAKQAILIGLAQACSVVPGVSRAGSVIVAMMTMGYKRAEAAKYTFLLSMPTIISAGLYDLYQGHDALLGLQDGFLLLGIGMLSAFVVAYLCLKWLIAYLSTHTLAIFGWYRLGLALALVIFKVLP